MSGKYIVLDRDGVINHDSKDYIKSPEEWHAIEGSLEAIARLTRADYRVVVITNQSGIGRGMYSINTLNRIHQKLLDQLQILGGEVSAFFFCPHAPDDNCPCRKPKPGMFIDMARRLRIDLHEVIAVGDSLRDIQASVAAGAKPALVRTGNGSSTLAAIEQDDALSSLREVPVFDDLSQFASKLLAGETSFS